MRLATGKWVSILMSYGLAEHFLNGKRQACPLCGGEGKSDRFRWIASFYDGNGGWFCSQCGSGDGMDLLIGISGLSFKEAAKWLKPIVTRCHYTPPSKISNDDRRRFVKKNVELWKSGEPMNRLAVNNTLEAYLEFRGLYQPEYDGADLRFIPDLKYYDDDGNLTGTMPAMLARICTRDGRMASIHRTYLAKLKEGGFKTKRKMTSSSRDWKGGCIRLFDTRKETRLIVAEGIETALSVRARTLRNFGLLIPCWAAVSADAMESIAIPEHIKIVMVAADSDESFKGQRSAFVLANRLVVHDKRIVKVIMPQTLGTDFNDELRIQTCQ
jgi:putative DNA primase/helicase